jgi:glycosyltransferase involved in cell wall biosynthesis
MKQHICFFLYSFQGGGTERVFINLAHAFLNDGYRVTFLVIKKSGEYISHLHPDLEIIELSENKVSKFKTIRSIPKIVSFIRNERPTAFFSALTINNIIAVIAIKISRAKCKLIVTEHSSFYWLNEISLVRAKIMKAGIKYLYRYADSVVAVSKGLADELISKFSVSKEKIVVIHNPLDINNIIDKSMQPINYDWFSSANKNIISVGRLTEQKNFSLLLTAFKKVKSQVPNAFLIILGEGQLRESLWQKVTELEISDSVAMPGFLDNPFSVMSRSNIFVLSSKYEGFGNVLVEALACGSYVVSTDCPSGSSEIIKNESYGKLVPINSEEDMVKEIVFALNNRTNKNFSIERAKDFDVSKIFYSYKNLIT